VQSPHKGADIAAQRSARHQESGWRAERGSSFAPTAAGNRCGAESDVAAAEAAIERLAEAPSDEGLDVRDIWLLRLRALLAQTHGDEVNYRDFVDRYRRMATDLGFEGHMAMAEAMP
jgi:hypothetical protein